MGKPIDFSEKSGIVVEFDYIEKPKKIYTQAQMYREVTCPNGLVVRIWNLNTIRDCYPVGAVLCSKRTPFGNRFGRGSDSYNQYNNWIFRQPALMKHIRLTLAGKTDLVCGDRCKRRCHVEIVAKIANSRVEAQHE